MLDVIGRMIRFLEKISDFQKNAENSSNFVALHLGRTLPQRLRTRFFAPLKLRLVEVEKLADSVGHVAAMKRTWCDEKELGPIENPYPV
ncbi:MAG: hypothetical protein ACO3A4_14620 [Silvanigrellaceae bacterium]